jgi:rhamnose transport system substrate-binding protein
MMRKSLLWLLVVVLSTSMILTFSLNGCKKEAPVEKAEEAVEEEAAKEAPAEGYTIGMIVKNLGNPFFEAAEKGAKEAAAELGDEVIFTGPDTPTAEGQIALIDAFIAQKVDVIAPVANDPDALIPICKKAQDAGIKVVAWNSPMSEGVDIYVDNPSAEGLGRIEVQMLGELMNYEGEFAILSAAATMPNQNLFIEWMKEELKDPKYEKMELVTTVYGDDLREKSYNEAMGLFKSYPDLKGIISPTTVGIAATACALKDEGLNGKIALTGLGLPSEMAEYIKDGTCEMMALFNPIDQGYLAVYAAHAMMTGEITGAIGETLDGGRMGEKVIEEIEGQAPTIIMSMPFIFNAENIDEWKDVY